MATIPTGFRIRSFAARLTRRARSMIPGRRTTYVSQRVEEYRRYWSDAAAAVGASFEELLPGVWSVRRGDQHTVLANYVTQCDDPIILQLAGDKPYGYRLAMEAGVPVPDHRILELRRFSEGVDFLEQAGGPLVVKPATGTSSGLGVTTAVRTRRQLASAVVLAALFDERLMVERMIPGESYRILYLEGCAIHAVRRRGLRLRGDGRSVSELLRAAGHGPLTRDPLVRETLAAQHLTLDTVPPDGEEVLVCGLPLRSNRHELRTVYDESVLDRCCPELLREGAAVVRALGSELAGVDIITTDPSVPLRKSTGAFIEINTTPGIHHHYVGETKGRTPPVAVTVLEYLLTRKAGC
jgi:cyanophycin synthetase